MNSATVREIRLLLVDDHAMFREGLVRLLEREPDLKVVGRCAPASEAMSLLGATDATMILLDFDLGAERAVDFILETKQKGFAGKILVVTAGVSNQEAVQLVQAGVAGILHKHNSPEVLCRTIRQVADGEVCLERDKMVLRFIFQGMANKEIGARLQISEGAVKASLRQLFQKLHVRTRAQLVKVALEQYRDQL